LQGFGFGWKLARAPRLLGRCGGEKQPGPCQFVSIWSPAFLRGLGDALIDHAGGNSVLQWIGETDFE